MNLVVKHALAPHEAASRIRGLLSDMKRQYGDKITALQEKWNGNNCKFRFKAMGFAVSGTLVVSVGQAELSGSLPWAALPFKGKVESTLRKRAKKLLS